jgi:hypothetical protein
MPGTYSQLLLHAVFSTKGRERWITPDLAERLYPYIGGQAAHHAKEDFRSELLRMLRAHGVEFDEKYVFD